MIKKTPKGGVTADTFSTIQTPSGTSPVADSSTDTLTLTASNGLVITGNSATDTVDFAISSSARVSLGLLTVGTPTGAAANYKMAFRATGTAYTDGIALQDSAGSAEWRILPEAGTILLNRSGASVGITLSSAGYVGVGASPVTQLFLGGDQAATDPVAGAQSAGPLLGFRNTNSTANNYMGLSFLDSGANTTGLMVCINEAHGASRASNIRFYTSNAGTTAEAMRINKDGSVRHIAAATGAGSASLGANCPATTVSAPNTWLKFEKSDGTVVYVPAWA